MSIAAKFIRRYLLAKNTSSIAANIDNLEAKRKKYRKMGKWMKPEKSSAVERIVIDGVQVDKLVNCAAPERTIIYMHGGGFVYGGNEAHMHMLSVLSRRSNAEIYAIDYRLAPEHPYPEARDDVLAVYRYLQSNSNGLPIALVGDSAGGNLAIVATIKLRNSGHALPHKVVAISPPLDGTFKNSWIRSNSGKDPVLSIEKLEFFLDVYRGDTPRDDQGISPYFNDLSGLPPVLFHVGEDEILYGDSYLMHKKILDSGGDSRIYSKSDLWHLWHIFTRYVPEARQAVDDIAGFLKDN